MIDRVIEFSVRNRMLVILAGVGLALWGVYALYQTPVDAIPDLSENQVIVFTDWLGHSPREVEDQVTYPLTQTLRGLDGVTVVRSSSDFNFSSISVIFQDSVDFYVARQRVSERLTRLVGQLPQGVQPELAPESLATGQIFWYTVEGAGYDLGRLRAVQDWVVRPQLASVPGVAEVASVGGYPVEFQIEIDPLRLRSLGVTLADVTRAVARSNSARGAHVVQKANAEYIVRGVGWIGYAGSSDEFDESQALRDIERIVVLPAGPALPRAVGAGESFATVGSAPTLVADVATVSRGGRPRRGVLEMDGMEVTGGVVLMRYGENPLTITERLKEKIAHIEAGLPKGVRIVSGYDRTPLIRGAIGTVTGTLVEAIVTASICVLIVLLHFRTSLVIAVTLPLATLASFVIMWMLRRLGIADIQTNIMSLAGIAISIGVLVDSSIVIAENVMHTLKTQFGDRPVRGDIRRWVLPACRTVGRPIFFSVLIMLISFIPVFALGGMEGKMFRPLAFTKSFAMGAVAILSITLVPALCTIFIKGRLRSEAESWVVRSFAEIYRPVLNYLLDQPLALVWIMSVTLVVGLAPLGNRSVFLATVFLAIVACGLTRGAVGSRIVALVSVLVVALVADQSIKPLGREFITPLDEGMAMDMPITVPRASVNQSADDLKTRDTILCRFPEVQMVMGKAGRAETATDPAPMDMIETMVAFRPAEFWPRRRLLTNDAEQHARAVLDELVNRGLVAVPAEPAQRDAIVRESVSDALPLFDNVMREVAYLKNQEFTEELARGLIQFASHETVDRLQRAGKLRRKPTEVEIASIALPTDSATIDPWRGVADLQAVTSIVHATLLELDRLGLVDSKSDSLADPSDSLIRVMNTVRSAFGGKPSTFFTRLHRDVIARHHALWAGHMTSLNSELLDRAPATFTRLVTDQLLAQATVTDERLSSYLAKQKGLRSLPTASAVVKRGHHGTVVAVPTMDPYPPLDSLRSEMAQRISRRLLLWPHQRTTLAGFGTEMDRVLQMPGWSNVWTMPIQNRVDMLATGVNTEVGVRVLGTKFDDVLHASEQIATVLKRVPGAADVVADPIRGKGYLEVRPDRDALARFGLSMDDVNQSVETALGGTVATTVVAGRERYPVRVRYARDWRTDEEAVKNVLVAAAPAALSDDSPDNSQRLDQPESLGSRHRLQIPLEQVADVKITEGPASIKTENGFLRNYVRMNVHDRSIVDFVEEAQRVVAEQIALPEGVFVEWTGQYEHQARATKTLLIVTPIVVILIFAILYLTYRDLADAALMMLAVPGAIAGGVFFQWLFGYKFSVTIWIGYLACFGMATSTGIIMLVYLREAVEKAGGLQRISLPELRQAVIDGAVHRLRPKLLTEGTTIIGLAPLFWATGTGAEVIKPMAAPVLGGILIADEVIDLFLPVLFYWVRRWRWQRLQTDVEPVDHSNAVSSHA